MMRVDFQNRVDGRGIATNVFNAVSDPHHSPWGFKEPPGGWVPTESFTLTTPDGVLQQSVYRTPEGTEIDRNVYDRETGICKRVEVERYFPAADGKSDIRRFYSLSLETAGAAGGPAAGVAVRYFKSTDFISHTPVQQTHNLGWQQVVGDPSSGDAVLDGAGLIWHGNDGEREVSYSNERIQLVQEKEADRAEWLLSQ